MGETQERDHHQKPAAASESGIVRKNSPCLCALMVLFSIALPVWAQQPRVYRDGNSWVEEWTGTLPNARELHVVTDLGSVDVQGGSPRITYTIRKRSYAPTEELARKQFDRMRLSAAKSGETDTIQGKLTSRDMMRFGAEFTLQV